MELLPLDSTDADLIAYIDRWAAIMESEDYAAALEFTDQSVDPHWTPDVLRQVIKDYDEADPKQGVTVEGTPTDIVQRKEVMRWDPTANGEFGEILYDLNIDGRVSDLSATFAIFRREGGISIALDDVHVM